MNENKQNTVVQGALLLTIAGLIGKVLSATYRIPLQNLTGDHGFYIYQQIYPLIGIVMILSLYGFPAAISMLTAEQRLKNIPLSIWNVHFPLFIIVAMINGVFFVAVYILSPNIAKWIGDVKLAETFSFAAYLFLFIPLVSIIRGTSQGKEDMRPTAYSQVMEQLFRVTIIIVVSYFVFIHSFGIYDIGNYAVFATMVGMIISTLVAIVTYRWDKSHFTYHSYRIPWKRYVKIICSIGLVAVLNHLILLLMQFVDVFTLVPSLVKGSHSVDEAMRWKGIFDRGQPLIQFGVVFGSSFALAIIPSVVLQNINDKGSIMYIREAILFSGYIAFAASLGLFLLMKEVNFILFKDTLGTESLSILSLSILLTAVCITAIAVLQTIGKMFLTAFYIIIAVICKWVLNILLVPSLSIVGSALATTFSLALLLIFIQILLKKHVPKLQLIHHIKWAGFIVSTFAMVIVVLASKLFLFPFIQSRLSLFICLLCIVLFGAFVYIACLIRFRVLTDRQMEALPFSRLFFYIQNK